MIVDLFADGEQWVCTCGWKGVPTHDDYASMEQALQHWDFHDPDAQETV